MGGGPGTAVAPLEDREPAELLGLRLPQPVVEPAAGDADAWRGDALDGPPPRAVAAQPARRRRSPGRSAATVAPTAAPSPASAGQQPVDRRRRAEPVRTYDATPAGPQPRRAHRSPARPVDARDALKRRRANVLFVLVLTAASTLFLAATTTSQPMIWFAVAADRRPPRLRLPARAAAPARARRAGAGTGRRARRRAVGPARRPAARPGRAPGAGPPHRSPPGRSARPAGRPPPDADLVARRLTPHVGWAAGPPEPVHFSPVAGL